MARLDPNLPVEELKTMPQQVRENIFLDRFLTTLSAAFALLATVLAAAMLLEYLGEAEAADRVRSGVDRTLRSETRTPDLGGSATTAEVTDAIIACL